MRDNDKSKMVSENSWYFNRKKGGMFAAMLL